MPAPVVHFEIGSRDSAALALFYQAVFDWTFTDMDAAKLVASGHEGGPSGMLNSLGHSPENYVMIYVEVADLEEAIARVEGHGGARMIPPMPLPDGRRFAWVNDPAGNLLGLLTPRIAETGAGGGAA